MSNLNTSWTYFDSDYVYQMFPELDEYLDVINLDKTTKAEYLTNLCKTAEAEFHSKIQEKYSIPLENGEQNFKVIKLVYDLLLYCLHEGQGTDKIPAKIVKRYDAALKELDKIADGSVKLVGIVQKSTTSRIAVKASPLHFSDLGEYF